MHSQHSKHFDTIPAALAARLCTHSIRSTLIQTQQLSQADLARMAETLLISPKRDLSPRVASPYPRAIFVPDQIVTPRSYGASLQAGPSSPYPSPVASLSSRSPFSPRIGTPSPREKLNSDHIPTTQARPLVPLGSLPPNRLRGSAPVVSFVYIWPVQHQPTLQYDDFTDLEIPSIDLACLQTGDGAARKRAVAQVRAACLNWGFFHAVNHGIPLELLERVQKQAQRFFSLPKEEKLKVQKGPGSYTGYGHAAVKPTDSQPWSEGFYLANDSSVDTFSQALWPQGDNKDFGDSYREYNEKVENLAKQLMEIIIEGLEVNNAAHFQRYMDKASGLLRWNHYPPCPQPHKALGMSAHTDFNLLTVLHQGDIGGLQVQKDGDWVAVKPQRDALAINIGDTLQVLTNALYKSVPHRAVVNRTQARISMAYFFAPRTGIEIVPSPELVDKTNKISNFKPFTIEEYLAVKKGQLLNTLEHFSLSTSCAVFGVSS